MTFPLHPAWQTLLESEWTKPYFQKLLAHLEQERAAGAVIYPPSEWVFNALNRTTPENVKVVILGQDPYHQAGQAMGLSFSVPKGVKIPPSLRNIYKELARSLPDFIPPKHGDLSAWADQGVLLLNSVLTVAAGRAASHSKIGWQTFTDTLIHTLSQHYAGIVFMLWGNYARQKSSLIDANKHHILTSAHPSPLAGNRFLGCNHFAYANQLLQANNKSPVNWQP